MNEILGHLCAHIGQTGTHENLLRMDDEWDDNGLQTQDSFKAQTIYWTESI